MGDLWDSNEKKTKVTILKDFDRPAILKIKDGMLPPKDRKVGQAKASMKIERFVDMVLGSDKPAYKFKKKYPDQFKETFIGQGLREILPLTRIFDSYHTYSRSPAVFFRAFWLVDSIYGYRLSRPIYRNVKPDMCRARVMNLLIDQIRLEAEHLWYKRDAYDRTFETKEKTNALVEYTAAILRYYSKTLVVRVDFSYEGKANAPVTIDRVLTEFHSMMEDRSHLKLFEHLVGYGWAVEQSDRKGFHIHAMFFFDGSKVRQDVTIGFAIGDYWVNHVTNGRGSFHNCNAKKQKYKRCGIGMIHRNNAQECADTIEFMQYLAKGGPFLHRDNQYLRIRPFGARTFGTGQAPKMEDGTRRGRPAAPAVWLDEYLSYGDFTSAPPV